MTRTDFTQRVRTCERRLYRVARTMLSCDADCEDAVQEALLKAWAGLRGLRADEYFETWLIRILINTCKAMYRHRRPTSPLPEDVPACDGDDHTVHRALMALPPRTRVAMELYYIEGYGVRDCARLLRVPEGTVKWRLSQGRKQLKDAIGEEDLP